MTIGMLVESLTSKVGALNGHFVDATPFQKCEKPDEFVNPIEEFGNRLELAGFAKHGGKSQCILTIATEVLCSGFTTRAMYSACSEARSLQAQCDTAHICCHLLAQYATLFGAIWCSLQPMLLCLNDVEGIGLRQLMTHSWLEYLAMGE